MNCSSIGRMRATLISTNVRKKAVWGRTAILGAAFAVLTSVPASAQKPAKVDEAVHQKMTTGESARVIMQFDTTAERDAAFNRLLDRGAAVRSMDTEGGPALNVVASAAALSPEIDKSRQVSTDAKVSVFAAKTPARALRVAPRTTKSTGNRARSGMSVAVIDSGVQPQVDLAESRIRKFVDFVSGGTKAVDQCGHGTHVAGTIAGTGRMSGGAYQGIDPYVDLVVLRVLGDDCSGNTSDVIDALEWVAKNHALYNIRVVNLSLGHPVFESVVSDPMVQAVERLSRKGIVVVTAAGNMGINPLTGKPGFGGVGVPCNSPSAVCVGALDTTGTAAFDDDRVADFSSRGPSRFDLLAKPDLVADGVNVVSLLAKGSKLSGNTKRVVRGLRDKAGFESYLQLSGTSMASPRVAGAAALMLTANPRLSSNAVKMALQFTARVLPGFDTLAQGAGALNAVGALRLAQIINPSAPKGHTWLSSALPKSNLDENGIPVEWQRRIIYGDRFMAANTAAVHMARWDDNIVWGFDTLDDNIVWGNNADDNIVWGNSWDDHIVWGENIVWGYWAENVVWGFWADNIVWGNVTRTDYESDNIVWGNDWDNIVWGNCTAARSNDADNIVWGNSADDNIVWGNNNCAAGNVANGKGGK